MINLHNNHVSSEEKMQKCRGYMEALEEERRKIQVFQRELPLCLDLVTQAIEACKQQLSGATMTTTTTSHEYNLHGGGVGGDNCSEQTSSDVPPVFEEFIPMKRASSDSDGDEQESNKHNNITITSLNSKKSDWLRSVQLWNQTPESDPPTAKQDSPRKVAVTEVKRSGSGGAFHPFKKESSTNAPAQQLVVPPASTSSTAETGGSSGNNNNNNKKKKEENKEKEGQSSSQRKSRRCWSPDLHRRFLQSLQQLGGSHVATPKQIRELMKVDGLTNDEVKSHLQKYRLHTRRPSPSIHNNNSSNNHQQAPQFVVVGGIWVPPEYAAMAATTTVSGEARSGVNTNGIYAPIATMPPRYREASESPRLKQQHNTSNSGDRGSHSKGGDRSHSPATSSSTHTTTASPAY